MDVDARAMETRLAYRAGGVRRLIRRRAAQARQAMEEFGNAVEDGEETVFEVGGNSHRPRGGDDGGREGSARG